MRDVREEDIWHFFRSDRSPRSPDAAPSRIGDDGEGGCRSRTLLPAPILEKSRMSLTMVRSAAFAVLTRSIYRRCGDVSLPVVVSRSTKPLMLVIGVRISWPMTARNSVLARIALS